MAKRHLKKVSHSKRIMKENAMASLAYDCIDDYEELEEDELQAIQKPCSLEKPVQKAKKKVSNNITAANLTSDVVRKAVAELGAFRKGLKPGDIYWAKPRATYGHEIANPNMRPCIIVSSSERNNKLGILQVVFTTTSDDRPDLPCYPKVQYDKSVENYHRKTRAICDQVNTIGAELIGRKIGRVSDDCLNDIRYGIMWAMGVSDEVLDMLKDSNKVSE